MSVVGWWANVKNTAVALAFRAGQVAEAVRTPVNMAPPTDAQARRTGYEYGIALGGTSASTQAAFSAERQSILNQLHQAYLTCPWLSAPVDVVARTATAGGLQIVYDDPAKDKTVGAIVPDDPPEVLRLRRLLRFTNPREDMIQLLRSVATDLWLFGDAYVEIVRLLGEPVALYTLDATTMTVLCDEHGEVSGYQQNMDGIRQTKFGVDDIIHVSLDAPRGGVYGVSPAQKALLPVTAWLFAEATIKENFRRGDPPRIHVDLGNVGDADAQRWREQYRVFNLGPKAAGVPIVTTKGGQVNVLDPRKVQDYLATTTQLRDEIISCMGVPPAKLGIIESGNLGGGTGESQDKAVDPSTPIPTPSGWTTMGELKVGDEVLDEAGRPCRVTGTYEVPNAESWRLTFSDGTHIDCCADHLWVTWTEKDRKAYGRALGTDSNALPHNWPTWRSGRGRGPQARRTADVIATLSEREVAGKPLWNHSIPVTGALELPELDLPVAPYTLGAWLGDGTAVAGAITCGVGDEQIIAEIRAEGYGVRERVSVRAGGRTPLYHVDGLRTTLRETSLFGDKHVPAVYLRASRQQRLALLQGLMDTDGGFSSGQQVLFRSTNERLADAVVELARSLGQKPVKAKGRAMLNGVDCGPQFGVTWTPTIQVFRLRRKVERWSPSRNGMRLLHRTVISAEKIPDRPMRCIRVDSPNHMYLVGAAMIPTHNTMRVNTIIPLQALILEKFNYQLVQVGFGITNWRLDFGEIDYRDSAVIEKIRDMRMRNGSWTVNRYRDEIDEPPIEGGDEAVIIDRQNMVLVRDLSAASQATIAAKLKGSALEPDEPVEGQALTIHKTPPAPAPVVVPMPAQPALPGPAGGRHRRDDPEADGLPDPLADTGDETVFDRDWRRLSESWGHAYRARRRRALEVLPPADTVPTDPYWDADAHNHNDVPDYTPADLGVTDLQRVVVDPRDVRVDHSYQRPQRADLVRRYADEPRQRLAERVGLLALRPDGSMWIVDGQHHTAAAVVAGITALTYQEFLSTGPAMEADVYRRLRGWHERLHRDERSGAARFGPRHGVKGLPDDRVLDPNGAVVSAGAR